MWDPSFLPITLWQTSWFWKRTQGNSPNNNILHNHCWFHARQPNRQPSNNFSPENQKFTPNSQQKGPNFPQWSHSQLGGYNQNPNHKTSYCQFCNISGHSAKECRKLSRFLRDNNISIAAFQSQNLVLNTITSSFTTTPLCLFDIGASHYVTYETSGFQHVYKYGGPDEILLGNGRKLPISHTGSTHIHTPTKSLNFHDILCVPNLKRNLISIAKPCKASNVSIDFFSSYFFVKDHRTGPCLMRVENTDDIYHATILTLKQLNFTTVNKSLHWHHKPGHSSIKVFKSINSSLGPKSTFLSNSHTHCPLCAVNKSHKLPFRPNSFVATKPLQLIYSDIWGPVQKSIDQFTYYVIFVDYYSKYVWLYLMHQNFDVAKLFPQFKILAKKILQPQDTIPLNWKWGWASWLISFLPHLWYLSLHHPTSYSRTKWSCGTTS